MKYRIACQKKGGSGVFRPKPVFDSYEEADKQAKIENEKHPDFYHWAEPAPEGEINPDQVGHLMLRAIGQSTVYKHPDGTYEHVIERRSEGDWPLELPE